jgi:branched-chain amino acid transport system substrate-binding protein
MHCASRIIALGLLVAFAPRGEGAAATGRTRPRVSLTQSGQSPLALTARPSSGRSAATIPIGVSNVQSGPSAILGIHLMQGSMAYFKRVNDRGGIHGRRLQVILKDDQYEPDPAVRNSYELITKDRVFFLFNYVGTPTLTRVLPLLKQFEGHNIVNVAPFTGAEPQRRPPYDRYVFNIRASYAAETRRLVDYLYAKGMRKIGVMTQADAYGKSGETGVMAALKPYGLRIVGKATYRRNAAYTKDMRAQVDSLRRSGADAVIAVATYAPCAAFIRDARLAGWHVPIANVSFVGAQPMLDRLRAESRSAGMDLTANLINSEVVPLPSDTRYPLVRDYQSCVPQEARSCISLEGWLNAAVVTEALRRAGPHPTRVDFIRAMESLGGWDPGLGAKLAFGPRCHQGLRNLWLMRSAGGRWVPAEEPSDGGRDGSRSVTRFDRPTE